MSQVGYLLKNIFVHLKLLNFFKFPTIDLEVRKIRKNPTTIKNGSPGKLSIEMCGNAL